MLSRFLKFLSGLSKRERAIFYGAAAILFLVFVDRFVLRPVMTEIRLLDERVADEIVAVEDALFMVSQRESLAKKVILYASRLEKAPTDDEEGQAFLKYVENIAVKSSVSLMNIKLSAMEEETRAKKYFLRLSCEAQMEQIVDFLYKIESSDKLLRVEKYHIVPKEEGSSIISCTMDISKYIIL